MKSNFGLSALMRLTIFSNRAILFGVTRVVLMGVLCYFINQEAGLATAIGFGLFGLYSELHRAEHMLNDWYRLLTGLKG